MPLHQFAKPVAASPEDEPGTFDAGHGDRDGLSSPWLDSKEACAYLRFTGPARLRSLYRYLKREGIPVSRRSPKRLLIARADLDRAIRRKLRPVAR